MNLLGLMNRKRRGFLALAMAAVVAAFLLHSMRTREPSYEGKTLTTWLEEDYPQGRYGARDYRGLGNHEEETKQAIRAMGTKAIPPLLRMLGAKDSPLKTKYVKLLEKGHFGQIPYTLAETYRERAEAGFRALGPQAKSAFPELVRLFYETNSTASAGAVLAGIGPEGIPIFRAGLTNEEAGIRAASAFYLGTYRSNAVAAVPGLVICLRDASANVRCSAAQALGGICLARP